MVSYHHASLFSPTLSTLKQALKKNFVTGFPGLDGTSLTKHPPHPEAMLKGHLDQNRKNVKSTQKSPHDTSASETDETIEMMYPTPDDNHNERTHFVYAATAAPGTMYSDITGKFVSPSSNGNNYLLLVYDFDSNNILPVPMKNRTKESHRKAYEIAHKKLVAGGCRPKLHLLDNECSQHLKDFMHDEGVDYQLVPPYVHRRNSAERAIRTFKNHFIAGLCSTDPSFPIHLWDCLLPQAEISLNLLRGSRINPKLSAWSQLHGHFDWNRTPLGPPGCKVLIHEKPGLRSTWSPHSTSGYYLGPALESYRCYTVYVTDTRTTRISDGVEFLSPTICIPAATTDSLIQASLHDIAIALRKPIAHPSPLLANETRLALQQITAVLSPTETPDTTSPLDPLPPLRVETTAAPPLRVEPIAQTTPALPTGPNLIEPDAATAAPPLRVEPIVQTTPALPTGPHLIEPDDASEAPQATKRVQFSTPVATDAPQRTYAEVSTPTAPTPDSRAAPTYAESTGPKARATSRRRSRQARTKTLPIADATVPPARVTSARAKRTKEPSNKKKGHQHRTRQATKRANFVERLDFIQLLHLPQFAYHGNAFNPDTGALAEYPELSRSSDGEVWTEANCNEIGLLAQGYKDTVGTNTLVFIHKDQVKKKPTYLRIVCAHRPEKANPFRIRWTIGGDRLNYSGDASTKTADLITCKAMFNSVISTLEARFMTADIAAFYLGTPLDPADYEYIKIHIRNIPQKMIDLYDLKPDPDGFVYAEVRKGMYGLAQAGRIANDRLTKFLEPDGYVPVKHTPGLWKHKTRDIRFTLVVDDFGIKYTNRADAEHLISTLEKHYKVATDWTGAKYCGLTLDWNYALGWVDISMPGYVIRALYRFMHPAPDRPEDCPYDWQRPAYGVRIQYATSDDDSPKLDANGILQIQEIVGVFQYYARAIDSTMLVALGNIGAAQASATTRTRKAAVKFLNYAATHPEAVIRYRRSDMILYIDSDASYLSAPKARSRYAGYHYLSDKVSDPSIAPRNNGALHVPCAIMREVLSSAAEAELGGCYNNAKEACPIRTCLEELGHPQPATPMLVDNNTAVGIANDTVKQKRSKAMDMRFYWLRDRVRQGQFTLAWQSGKKSRSDYFTKTFPAPHHRNIRPFYFYDKTKPNPNYYDCLSPEDLVYAESPDESVTTHPAEPQSASLHQKGERVHPVGEGVLIPPVTRPATTATRRPARTVT